MPVVGVLALQGAFAAHEQALTRCGAVTRQVRQPADLDGIDAIVLPGGESSTMSKLLLSSGLFDSLKSRLHDGLPVFGTCAGMILLAADVLDGRPDQRSFGVVDVVVRRNAYGRQNDSFETDIAIDGLDVATTATPFHAVFIRAPRVESTGPAVEVLARHDGHAVVARQGAALVASFHPELTADLRLHQLFLRLAGF
ncbi:MAG: pyridoxal 5'-phosphate synthase glutaminase subunit PdxT [Ilumatobacteraceae bacterium]